MNNKLVSFSIIFLGLCIVLAAWFISRSLASNKANVVVNEQKDNNRYEFIKMADDYSIIFDKQSGDYWGNLNGEWKKQSPLTTDSSN